MRAAVAVVVVLAVAPGCSLAFVDRVPASQPASATPRCTATSGYGWMDLFWTSTFAATGMELADDDPATEDKVLAGFAFAAALVHGYSAIAGWERAERCREARATHDAWLVQRHPPPNP